MQAIRITGVHKRRIVAIIVVCVLLLYILSKWYRPSIGSEFETQEFEEIPQEPIIVNANGVNSVPYTSSGRLKFKAGKFYLNEKMLTIISGAMHYFRVVPEYWEDRMLKMKACGLNTLETYVSWNLHEEYPGEFNFDKILNIREYIKMAQKVGLYVIFRPGPFICSEWDFGGLPAWLLHDPKMRVRSNYKPYMEAVDRFFKRLFSEVADLQYSKGGPIIALQIENEFGSYSKEVEHLAFLKSCMLKHGADELFLTSDGFVGNNLTGMSNAPFFEQALVTANFQDFQKGKLLFDAIRKISPDFPFMTMEFWSGWFDHWGKRHTFLSTAEMAGNLTNILEYGASVNFYMFHGGTNFGFMSGSNYFPKSGYNADTTSYDYDAPLSEAGDLTEKYYKAREIILKLIHTPSGAGTLEKPPPNISKFAYGEVKIQRVLSFEDMLSLVEKTVVIASYLQPMEMLNLHGNYGQNFGYILYRTVVKGVVGTTLKFMKTPKDRVQVYLNGKLVCESNWWVSENTLKLKIKSDMQKQKNQLDLFVENHGRVNFVRFQNGNFSEERKGITSEVFLDGEMLKNWQIFPLDFRQPYLKKVLKSNNWKDFTTSFTAPSLYQSNLNINEEPQDTFLFMKGWGKGIVFINGFNLGRYWSKGPQKTLYVPAPVLQRGDNSIVIFEHTRAGTAVSFQDKPILNQLG